MARPHDNEMSGAGRDQFAELTELLARGDVAGAQALLDRCGVGGGRWGRAKDHAGQPGDSAAGVEPAATLRDRILAAQAKAGDWKSIPASCESSTPIKPSDDLHQPT